MEFFPNMEKLLVTSMLTSSLLAYNGKEIVVATTTHRLPSYKVVRGPNP